MSVREDGRPLTLTRWCKAIMFGSCLAAASLATVAVSSSGHASDVSGHRPRSAYLGFWTVSPDGQVDAFGAAKTYGAALELPKGNRAAAIAGTIDGRGYWVVTSKGRVFALGDARAYGGLGGRHPVAHPGAPVVGITPTTGDKGYWLVDRLGQVYSFGHAHFFGPKYALRLRSSVVSLVADPRGKGYWLVTRGGQVLGFGAARVFGSVPQRQSLQVTGMAATPDGKGYWLVTRQGQVQTFGDAHYYGSTTQGLSQPIAGIAPTPDGAGYWLLGLSGQAWGFGDAHVPAASSLLLTRRLGIAGVAASPLVEYVGGHSSRRSTKRSPQQRTSSTTASDASALTTTTHVVPSSNPALLASTTTARVTSVNSLTTTSLLEGTSSDSGATSTPNLPTLPPVPSATTAPTTSATTAGTAPTTAAPTTGSLTPGTCTNPSFSSSDAEATDNVDPGDGYEYWWVNNDAWSGSHGPQTIYVCSQSSWYAVSDQPNIGGQVETYPDTEYDVGGRNNGTTKTIAQYSSITSTFSEDFPSAGSWDAAYDLWLNNWSIEVMIWNQWSGGQAYWPSVADTSLTLDGVPYTFYDNNGELMFFRASQVATGSVDILAAFDWLVSHGYVSSSDIPTQLEYGVEVASTNGPETFPVTDVTFSLG